MLLVDSSGWIEYFRNGPLRKPFGQAIESKETQILSSVQIYEIYKVLKRDVSEEKALEALAALQALTIIPLDASLAVEAADLALEKHLAMADAVIYATAKRHRARFFTKDSAFQGLPSVVLIR